MGFKNLLQFRILLCTMSTGTNVLTNDHPPVREEPLYMTNVEKLIDYIKTLTPEQADKVIRQMPRLTALAEEPFRPDPQSAPAQSQLASFGSP